MVTRTPCERAVVVVTPKANKTLKQEVFDMMSQMTGTKQMIWKCKDKDQSLEDLRVMLDGYGRAMIIVDEINGKAVKQITATARKKGYVPYVLEELWEDHGERIEMPAEFVLMDLDKRHETGPFDIIGDIHGCAIELMELLEKLGHAEADWEDKSSNQWDEAIVAHKEGRKVILLGDLVDRGPENLLTMKIAKKLEEFGGMRVQGNHDSKIGRWLKGNKVNMGPHQQPTITEFAHMTDEERNVWGEWMLEAGTQYVLDDGKLVVAHAGMDEDNLGRNTDGARAMALYGKPVEGNALDAEGFPVAEDWAMTYNGDAVVVHGHVVYDEPRNVNDKVIAVDTGCVFGGKLTAYQWPERQYVEVNARKEWWKRRPIV